MVLNQDKDEAIFPVIDELEIKEKQNESTTI